MTVHTSGEALLSGATDTVREAVTRARSEIAPRLEQLAATVEEASSEHGPAGVTSRGATVGRRLRRTAATVRPESRSRRWTWAVGLLVAGAAGAWGLSVVRRRRADGTQEHGSTGWEPVPQDRVDETVQTSRVAVEEAAAMATASSNGAAGPVSEG
jgi:hypothetical protein